MLRSGICLLRRLFFMPYPTSSRVLRLMLMTAILAIAGYAAATVPLHRHGSTIQLQLPPHTLYLVLH